VQAVWLLLAFVLVLPVAAVRADPIVVTKDFHSAPFGEHISYLRDPSGTLDIEAASKSLYLPAGGGLAFGYSADALWLKLVIDNRTGLWQDVFLDMRPVFLDEVTVYSRTREGIGWQASTVGDHVPMSERPSISASLIASVLLPPGRSDVFMRVKTTSSLAIRGTVRSPGSMITSATAQTIRFGLFEGVFLVMFMANLLYWWWLGDRIYLAYALTLLSQLLLFLGNNGFLPPEFVPGAGPGVDRLLGLFVLATVLAGAWFVMVQTGSVQRFRLTHTLLRAIALASVLAVFPTATGHYQYVAAAIHYCGMAVFALAAIANIRLALRGVPGTMLAAIGCLSLLAGVAVTVLRLVGMLPYNVVTDFAFETGSLAFILYMQVALVQRTSRAERERFAAQEDSLRLSRRAEDHANRLVRERTDELATARDAAEAALAAEHAAQAEQLRFIDVVSHQYRTPLAVVSNSASSIAATLPEGDANHGRIERIRRAVGRLVELIDVNLHRSRLDGASARPEFGPIALADLLDDAMAHARDTCGERPFSLHIDETLDGWQVSADSGLMNLALINLIENAQKFSPPGAQVDLAATLSAKGVAISVADRGIGIPDDERIYLTSRYFRASNSANTSGMGLGLSMVATIAASHGGSLSFAARPGGGTIATITLPDTADMKAQREVASKAKASRQASTTV
jgi:signal transduction histidine kinase